MDQYTNPQQQPYPQGHPYPQQSYPAQQPYPNSPPQQQQKQQQQSSVTVVNAGQPQIVGHAQPVVNHQSFCGHITLACFVFWCCGCICGGIAFILAMIATDRAGVGKGEEARKLGKASIGVSIAGIVVGCIVIAIAVGVSVSSGNKYTYSYNNNNNNYANTYCYSSYYGGYGYYC